MFRLILLLVLLAVSFYGVKLLMAKWGRRLDSHHSVDKNKQINSNMVRCACCDLFVPEKEAIKQGDKVFCSLKHANQCRE